MKMILLVSVLLPVLALAQPYQPHAIWSREGAGDSSLYGSEILALGDQNDDGYNDWAVYAAGLGYAPPGSPNEPKVEFFYGGNPPETEPYMVRVADRATEISVRGARALGDLNGDGYVDWYIFTGYLGDTTGRHIYKIYFGGPGPHEEPDLILTSGIWSAYYGIGDFNSDGYGDLFLGDGWNERASIFFGGNPMDTIPDWQKADDYFPVAGDLNTDELSDLICRSNHGYSDVYYGSTEPDTIPDRHWLGVGPAIIRDLNNDGVDELCSVQSGWGSISWGAFPLDLTEDAHLNFPCSGSGPQAILSAGDLNGDSYGDVVMFHQWCESSYGGVLTLHLGGWWINPVPAFVIYGWTDPFNLIHFKAAVNLGDINGDRVDDLAIGANGGIEYAAQRGKAVVLSGDTSLIAGAENPHLQLPSQLEVNVYPNPFNSNTTIMIHLPVYAHEVFLTIYNLLGQEVFQSSLANTAGDMTYPFDASMLSSGLYLLRVSSGNLQTTTKLMLLR